MKLRPLVAEFIGTFTLIYVGPGSIAEVNAPSVSKAQWRVGAQNGELRIGSSGEESIPVAAGFKTWSGRAAQKLRNFVDVR